MRLISKGIVAGVAAIAVAGTAYAADRSLHVTRVAAPDGTVVQVRYAGDIAPQVAFVPVQVQAVPVAVVDPFADFDRIAAAMDAQMTDMMRMASTMPAVPVTPDGKPDMAALKGAPGGVVSYSYYSSTGANGCTQTVRMTSTGKDAAPKIERASSGDCGTESPDTSAAAKTASTPVVPAPATPPVPATPAKDPRNII